MTIPPRTVRDRAAVLGLLATVVLAACAGPATTAGPAATGAPSASTSEPAAGTAAGPGGWLACVELEAADCATARDLALASAEGLATGVASILVGRFACAEPPCPRTLDRLSEGQVTIDFRDERPPALVALRKGADGTWATAVTPALDWFRLEPASPRVAPGVATPFSLGHCGLYSGIDADGSFWDPVGAVTGDIVNARDGTITVTGPDTAEFRADALTLSLGRHPGPKHLPGCM